MAENKTPESSVSFSHFAGLEALDPTKRELLEARFSAPRPFSQDSQTSNASSTGSDREYDQSTPGNRGEKHAGRKRKAAPTDGDSPSLLASKSGRGDSMASNKITEYFKNDSPARTSSPSQNLLPSFTAQCHIESSLSNPVPVRGRNNSSSRQDWNDDLMCISIHEACQTSLTMSTIKDMENHMSYGVEKSQKKDDTIQDLKRLLDSYKEEISKHEKKEDELKQRLQKCTEVNEHLLLEAARLEKKRVRENCSENRLRLGQFVPVRQGAQFVDSWSEGYAFKELNKQQEKINQKREELEKQKKLLVKKKPSSGATVKDKKGKSSDGEFTRPLSPVLSPMEYYEKEEILKLRAAALKKEETELQLELDKLDRERSLHIREIKRLQHEDNSRFKNHPKLNNQYLLLSLLGKGGFSEVYKGYDLVNHRYVACKIHQLIKEWKEDKKANYIKHALREYNIHKSLNHPRIVQLYDVFEIDVESFCTVLEYCDGNDLDFLLKQHKTVPEREAKCIVMQTVRALKYLNEIKPPVIHYDLKPGNILLVGTGAFSGETKITDFGLSKIFESDEDDSMELTSQGAGTYWYLPPECFVVGKEPPKISSKVDVWSVGVIFYQMLYGRKPFGHDQTQASILENRTILKAREVEFPAKPVVSSEAKNFIRRCLAYRKDDRADVLTLCDDVYLKPTSKKTSTAASSS
ncbi:serine/threonine-protein kinase tousled-like 2 isoform X2 [Nematostella vectensis]|uniref:serine/threonine-protein kinase tousled-like 2 isoform X2 n=1 Tax=Nematostella vectensis TaxID=45351 RepID=UPI0020776352|nr:serine/threonine-protein kinase tousled-like 2 isoform X2 [Nematostella vectensis]